MSPRLQASLVSASEEDCHRTGHVGQPLPRRIVVVRMATNCHPDGGRGSGSVISKSDEPPISHLNPEGCTARYRLVSVSQSPPGRPVAHTLSSPLRGDGEVLAKVEGSPKPRPPSIGQAQSIMWRNARVVS